MLTHLKSLCKNCSLCPLGKTQPTVNGKTLDPHVFSNMLGSKYVVIGQNPGFNECVQDEPFVGQASQTFNTEVEKHGLKRDMFYITNILHCYTENNRAPSSAELAACRPLVQMELMHLKPRLVITLGKFAFQALCPGGDYAASLGTIVKSDFIPTKELSVFPIFHPSGMNLSVKERKDKFEKHIALMCKLISHWETNGYTS